MPNYQTQTHYFDVVILGAGGAGLVSALEASKKNLSVACISKVHPIQSHTAAAKGGINAALGNVALDDWRWHMYDTLHGSDWLADHDAVELMCQKAPDAIRYLEHLGMAFTRQADGQLYQRIYGGQSSHYGKGQPPPRACCASDRTGLTMLQTLHQHCLKQGIIFFDEHFGLDLIIDNNHCHGMIAWDMTTGTIRILRAHHVILASGGFGQLYKTNTSSSICTGDGNAMALRAGLPLQDMEFIQFHPTGLHGSGFLVTEAARGEGAYLTNAHNERFMERHAPSYKDLAARDIIARAMATEIIEGRGIGNNKDHLHLHLEHLDPAIIKDKLSSVYDTAKTFAKVDPTIAPIPVLPSAHYTMGGIATNHKSQVMIDQSTIIPGLFAIGETACTSVHGANRLGCNGLLELVVFGMNCVNHLCTNTTHHKPLNNIGEATHHQLHSLFARPKTSVKTPSLRNDLAKTLSHHVGVFRNQTLLQQGLEDIQQLCQLAKTVSLSNHSLMWNNELLDFLELSNLLSQALATTQSALQRKESRGSHYRTDFPNRNDNKWLTHSLCKIDKNFQPHHFTRKVRMTTSSEDLPSFSPEKRKY